MAAASATAVVSDPPRPSVVTSLAVETPWKPATSTILPSCWASRMRSARTSRMRAFVCEVSVTMPACEPVSEIARWPRSLITIAARAHDWRSPVDRSMSISRGSGVSETSSAIRISSSVVCPRAERTATTSAPDSFAATIRPAARLMRSASATEVPPNFITTSCAVCGATATEDSFRALAYRPGPLAVALVIAATGLGVAFATGDDGTSAPRKLPPAAGDGGSGPASHVSFLQKLIPPPPTRRVSGPATPRSLADLARRLPIERAVAQLFLFGFDGKDATAPIFDELLRLDLGGVVLDGRNYDSPQQLSALAGEPGVVAAQAAHVPPWVMAEQDGGDYSQFDSLPPAKAPGDYGDAPAAAAAMTEAITALKALGVNGLLEPDL